MRKYEFLQEDGIIHKCKKSEKEKEKAQQLFL